MSRYVWGVYETEYFSSYTTSDGWEDLRYVNSDGYVILASSMSFNSRTGGFTLSGNTKAVQASDFTLGSTKTYPYLATGNLESQRVFYNTIFYSINSKGYWRGSGSSSITITCDDDTRAYFATETRGDFVKYVSSDNYSAYPDGGTYGSYYYKAIALDNIDPSAVTIPATINGGESAQAVITESVSGSLHSYGTIKYQYQMQLDGGSWQNIITSTSASETFTVPEGTNTVRVRVRVQDGLGYVQSTWVYSDTANVINNIPPTAPANISVSYVHSGDPVTITLAAATDNDGTVVNYIYERSADGGEWEVFATVNSLTQTDQVSVDWGTVAYRACAVDDDGAQGPYATTETFTVNKDYIMISGPDSNIGTKKGPFGLSVTLGVSGDGGENVKDISVSVSLDDETIYTGTKDSGQILAVIIDTRFLTTGSHSIKIVAEKGGYMTATAAYVFDIDKIDMALIAKAKAGLMQNNKGEAKLPYTLAQLVIVDETGTTLADVLSGGVQSSNIASGTYQGTGSHGRYSKNQLQFQFAPKFLVVAPQGKTSSGIESDSDYGVASTPFIVWAGQPGSASSQGPGYVQSANNAVSVSGNTISWYSEASAEYQLNASGTTYYYFAVGEASA